jgi:ADP-heptose:LPS heptosyltransferase
MVGALRRAYPGATIDWLVEASTATLLHDHPWLDDLITVPKGWIKQPRELLRVARRLRREHYDLVIDPQSLLKSAVAVLLSGAKRRIGFAPPQAREKSHWFTTDRVLCGSQHIVQKHLELLTPLGIDIAEPSFRFPEFIESQQRIREFIERSRLTHDNWYTIFAGASWPSKRWEPDRFAEVARRVAAEQGWRAVVTWGSPAEHDVARKIVAESDGGAVLAGKLSLPDLQVLLQRSQFYVGADTGPMHIAAASGTSCVGLFGPTKPEHCGPFGDDHIVVQAFYQAGSTRQRKRAANDAMRTIKVPMVIDACTDLIQARSRRAA